MKKQKTLKQNEQGSSEVGGFKTSVNAVLKKLIDLDKIYFYLLSAFLILIIIESFARRSFIGGFAFLFTHPIAFLINYGIILLTILTSLVFKRRIAVMTLITALWLALGITEFVLLSFRVTPLTAVDFSILGSVFGIIGIYLSIFEIILLVTLIVAAIAGIVVLFIKTPKFKIFLKRFFISLASSAAVFVAVVFLGFGCNAVDDSFPNLTEAYDNYGFAYCFLMSVFDKGIDKPDEYSKETVEAILGEVEAFETTDSSDKKPNVIFVQLESFFDVSYLTDIKFSENPTPTFTELKEKYISGFFSVPVVGAGTVNTELEVLSGLRVNDFGAGEYPYKSIISEKACETIAYTLSESGYKTHAIHNHQGTFYSRHEVYKNLGFDSFTSIEFMLYPEYNENEWAKDIILTDEILHILESTEEQDFVFAVSVQGHGRYSTDYEAKEGDILVTEGLETEEDINKYTYYVNQIKETDNFIKELYEAVMAFDEDTVLVLYGDHLPSLSIEDEMLETESIYKTEYVILSNYETELTKEVGDISAYQLYPAVMELIGNNNGILNMFHRACKDSEDYLEKLKTLEYDTLYGKQYAYGEKDDRYLPKENMQLGVREIEIDGYSYDGTYIYITGKNFTPYSVVTLDGNECDTEYIDQNTLKAKVGVFDRDATSASVQQSTSNGVALRTTVEYSINLEKEKTQ